MREISAQLEAHLQSDVTSLAYCWLVEKNNGEVLRGTTHDQPLTISSGIYAGTYSPRTAVFATDVVKKSDGSVSNMEVEGALRVDALIGDLRVEEIEAGLYDQARAVLLLVNWRRPDDGQIVEIPGTLGEFYRDSNGVFRAEIRSLAQALSQQILRTYGTTCDVKVFGDSRCKFDVAAATRTATVTEVTNRKHFTVALDAGPEPLTSNYYDGARLVFTSGANETFIRETRFVMLDETAENGTVILWEEAPADIEVGDTISLPPGCNRLYTTCRDVHQNLVNFRGHGIFAVGRDRLMQGPL